MSCSTTFGPTQKTLVATSTTLQYEWMGGWELAIGVTALKAVIKRRTATAFQAQFAIQTAPVRTDKPNAPVPLGTPTSGEGETCSTVIDLTSYTSGNFWIRVGVAYSATSATVGSCDVTFTGGLSRCGRSLGVQVFTLSTLSTTNAYQPITGWQPALDLEVIKAAIVTTGIIGNFRFRLAYRRATTSQEVPGAWSTDLTSEWSQNGEAALSDTPLPSVGAEMWVQIGIQYYLSTGSALGQATVSVALAGKR